MTSILDGLLLLWSLTIQDRENLSIFCQERHIAKWEVLFKEGDYGNAMYFLKKGRFKILKNINWEQLRLWEVTAEEILGEMALFEDRNTRMATAIAEEDSVLVIILDFSIQELKIKHPEVIEKIKQIIEYRSEQNKEKTIY